MVISKLSRVSRREVWRDEARDFTTWLQKTIDVLNDATDMVLSEPRREQSAGMFRVDLVAEDEAGNPVVIENQLARSDHDHLGKLITSLTAIEAKIAIWIVADPRPEHVKAISWLNDSSAARCYLFKVEAVQIDGPPPAPLLTLIVGPGEETTGVAATKKDIVERYDIRRRFWTQPFDIANEKTPLHPITPPVSPATSVRMPANVA